MIEPPKLVRVSEETFFKVKGPRRLISDPYSRAFALLHLGENAGEFGLAWSSDLVEPFLRLNASLQVVWVGIDQYLTAVDMQEGMIKHLSVLYTNLVDLDNFGDVCVAMTEDLLVSFNANFSIRRWYPLRRMPQKMRFDGVNILVDLIDGATELVPL